MDAIIQQLGLDTTYFVEIAIFFVVFALLGQIYFKPFLKFLQERYGRTGGDLAEAERLMNEANEKLAEYEMKIMEARKEARREFENLIANAKKQENEILATSREEAKKIIQETAFQLEKQKDDIKKQLEVEVESLALQVSEKIMMKKA